jgi:hypothetical protein
MSDAITNAKKAEKETADVSKAIVTLAFYIAGHAFERPKELRDQFIFGCYKEIGKALEGDVNAIIKVREKKK